MATGLEQGGKTVWLFSHDATPDVSFPNNNGPYAWRTFKWQLSNPISNTEHNDGLPYERRPMRVAISRLVLITSDETLPGYASAPTAPFTVRVSCEELRANNYMSGSGSNALMCDVSPRFEATEGGKLIVFERPFALYSDVVFTQLSQLTLTIEQRPLSYVGNDEPWGPLANIQSFMVELRFI